MTDQPVALFDLVGGPTLQEGAQVSDRLVSVADKPLVRELGGSDVTRRRTRTVFGEVAGLLASGRVTVTLGKVFPFNQAHEAVAEVETGHAVGKIAVTLG